jgi:hypothetical protein
LLDLVDPEDGGDMFLRNVGWLSTDYRALYATAVRISNPTYLEMVYDPFLLNHDHVHVSLDAY